MKSQNLQIRGKVFDYIYRSNRNNAPLTLTSGKISIHVPDYPSFFAYFVRMCFSFFAVYKKLLAYALGAILRSCGSCTKYS